MEIGVEFQKLRVHPELRFFAQFSSLLGDFIKERFSCVYEVCGVSREREAQNGKREERARRTQKTLAKCECKNENDETRLELGTVRIVKRIENDLKLFVACTHKNNATLSAIEFHIYL